MSTGTGTHAPWRILMVCTGNVCRSPMAELLARKTLAEYSLPDHPNAGRPPAGQADARFGIVVSSAGTRGWDGSPMQEDAATALAERGIDPTGFRARSLTPAMLASSDLVLCATRSHRAEVVTMLPRAVRRCFTMAEFARLTEHVAPADLLPPASHLAPRPASPGLRGVETAVGTQTAEARPPLGEVGRRLVEAAARERATGRTVAGNAARYDVLDPLGRGLDAFRTCADQISDAVCRPFELLGRAGRMAAASLVQ